MTEISCSTVLGKNIKRSRRCHLKGEWEEGRASQGVVLGRKGPRSTSGARGPVGRLRGQYRTLRAIFGPCSRTALESIWKQEQRSIWDFRSVC